MPGPRGGSAGAELMNADLNAFISLFSHLSFRKGVNAQRERHYSYYRVEQVHIQVQNKRYKL